LQVLTRQLSALRNYPFQSSAKKKLPTLIVTPQDGVQYQWLESLVKGGVEQARITIIGEKRSDRLARVRNSKERRQGGKFIICTRYKVSAGFSSWLLLLASSNSNSVASCQTYITSELKYVFEYSSTDAQKTKPSLLFQNVPRSLIKQLRQQYRIEKGLERVPHYNKNKKQDCVTKIVARTPLKKIFETVIIDEIRFLCNVLAYWGLGASVIGMQSKRTILLSGTPYNNAASDMSALMTLIDPLRDAAKVKWWDNATKGSSAAAIIKDVSSWKT
jgi:hypothetical protein